MLYFSGMRFDPAKLEILVAKTALNEFGSLPSWLPKQLRSNLQSQLCMGGNFQELILRHNEPNCFQQIMIEPNDHGAKLTFRSRRAQTIMSSSNVTLTIPFQRATLTAKDKGSLFGYPPSSRGWSHIYIGGKHTTITLSAISGNHRAMLKIKVREAGVRRVISVEGRRWIINQRMRIPEFQMIP